MSKAFPRKEQRQWTRLKLAIPVFVRTETEEGKETLEFATAVNVSAGGALVAVRRSPNPETAVSLEIPSAPIGPLQGIPPSGRTMRARAVWIKHLDDYHLLGLKFTQALSVDGKGKQSRRLVRKSPSAV